MRETCSRGLGNLLRGVNVLLELLVAEGETAPYCAVSIGILRPGGGED